MLYGFLRSPKIDTREKVAHSSRLTQESSESTNFGPRLAVPALPYDLQ
jgi:hypothetical protein